MGCFRYDVSDIDLLVVVEEAPSREQKRRFLAKTVELHCQGPKKGVELSIVRREVCRNFLYPTPYELHFSGAHLQRWLTDPEEYIDRMQGTDPDLAAHFTVTYHRGETLLGASIREVFSEVPKEAYLKSLLYDIGNAPEEIAENPVYFVLNLCRVLAYKQDGVILSKKEGGEWGLKNDALEKYRPLIAAALQEYKTGIVLQYDLSLAEQFAKVMVEKIKTQEK